MKSAERIVERLNVELTNAKLDLVKAMSNKVELNDVQSAFRQMVEVQRLSERVNVLEYLVAYAK